MQQEAEKQLDQLYVQPSFAVLPIFNTSKLVWGYQLAYRGGNGEKSSDPSGDKDLAALSAIGAFLMNPTLDGSRKKAALLLPFSEASILESTPLELPYEPTAVIVQEEMAEKEGFLEALASLKKQKHLVVIDNPTGKPGYEELLRCADIIFIDIAGKKAPEIAQIVQHLLPLGTTLGAKGVESPEQLQAAKDLGFTLFQGGFFQKPEVAPDRKLSSSTVSRFRLCHIMAEEYPNLDELTKIIKSDVALSYRFLSFVNSAAFGFQQKTDSIKRAFVHIGWEKIKSWLWIMIIADIQPKGKTSELSYLSAVRGKFLETIGIENKKPGIKPNSLFLLGLFSLLEAMLDLPAAQIMESLPLEDKIKAVLCHEENEYSDWLEMAKCFESGDWNKLDHLLENLHLDPMKAASAYCKAIVWTKTFYSQPVDEPKSKKVGGPAVKCAGGDSGGASPQTCQATDEPRGIMLKIGSSLKSVFKFKKK